AWGHNGFGQCDVPAPNTGFVALAAEGGAHSMALKADGSVVVWGKNDHGECDVPAPNAGFLAVSAGNSGNSVAVKVQSLCPADLDGDGIVGIADLLALLAAWGTDPGGPPDFDGDGSVGVSDLLALLSSWGPCI
ncbi:MAG: hypothetical protein ACYS0G_06005, partial [Planctomycetota bacterium]